MHPPLIQSFNSYLLLFSGIGFGMIYSPSVIIVGFYFEKWRALATGIAVCGSGIGMLVMAPLSTQLITSLGWRDTLRIHGAMVAACIISGLLFRPLPALEVNKRILILNTHTLDIFIIWYISILTIILYPVYPVIILAMIRYM